MTQLDPQDQQRFEEDLPAWLAGRLDASRAQWMHTMQQRHAALAEQVRWLAEARAVLREEAGTENTERAWSLLMQKMQADEGRTAAKAAPRWLHWMFGHPLWANAAAALAVLLVVGQAAWIVSSPGGTPAKPAGPEAGWRSTDLEDLQPSAEASATRIQIRLQDGSRSADMALLSQLAQSAQPVAAAGLQGVAWHAQPDGTWILQIRPAVPDAAALLHRIQAQPAVRSARLLPSLP